MRETAGLGTELAALCDEVRGYQTEQLPLAESKATTRDEEMGDNE